MQTKYNKYVLVFGKATLNVKATDQERIEAKIPT